MNAPYFSIIIPVYNDEEHLDACFDSIIKQKFNDFEVIFIDDCSSDDTLEKIKSFQNEHNCVRFIHNDENTGQTVARQKGVSVSRGEYVTFCDADDTLTESALQIMYDATQEHPDVGIIHLDLSVISKNAFEAENHIEAIGPENVSLSNYETLLYHYVKRKGGTNIWGKVYRGELCKMVYATMPVVEKMYLEDIFTSFYFDYYSNGYVGMKGKEHAVYNYSLDNGVSGTAKPSLEIFERYARTALAYENLLRFIKNNDKEGDYSDVLQGILERVVACVHTMMSRMESTQKKEAIKLFLHYWGNVPEAMEVMLEYCQNEINFLKVNVKRLEHIKTDLEKEKQQIEHDLEKEKQKYKKLINSRRYKLGRALFKYPTAIKKQIIKNKG